MQVELIAFIYFTVLRAGLIVLVDFNVQNLTLLLPNYQTSKGPFEHTRLS